MSFYRIQSLITLAARLGFFVILFLAFRASDIPPLPLLSPAGTSAFLALLLIIPLGHASSFWFMTVAVLSLSALIYAAANLMISPLGWYAEWHMLTLKGYLPFLFCAAYLLIGLVKAKHIVKTRYSIRTDRAFPAGRLRIAHLADIHPHRPGTLREIAKLYRIIDEENPDLIALTGDIFDEYTTPAMFSRYIGLFAALHPKYGIYYVFGNHDASSHWKKPAHTKDDIIGKFPKAGVKILEDECETTAGGAVSVIGRKEAEENRLSPAELIGKADEGSYKILLCHEPVEFSACAQAGADLILAGHTHGGQIFPLGIFTDRILGLYDGKCGMIDLGQGKNAVITSGAGTWSYPIRTEGKSEVVIIDILGNNPGHIPKTP